MDKKRIKRIIAKEGLILLAFIILGIIVGKIRPDYGSPKYLRLLETWHIPRYFGHNGKLIIIFGYPIYLSVRFVFWAIKTLKQK